MDIPPAPRGGDSFREFYEQERNNMAALATVRGGGLLHDPEQTAVDGWKRFYPHWSSCASPAAYLRSCVLSAVRDELRALGDPPAVVPLDDVSEGLMQGGAAPGRDFPEEPWPVESWQSWDPPMAAALDSLSDKLRDVVLLDCELPRGQRPVAEIAQILGISRATAHMRLKRAYDKLSQLLPDGYIEEQGRRRHWDAGELEKGTAP